MLAWVKRLAQIQRVAKNVPRDKLQPMEWPEFLGIDWDKQAAACDAFARDSFVLRGKKVPKSYRAVELAPPKRKLPQSERKGQETPKMKGPMPYEKPKRGTRS